MSVRSFKVALLAASALGATAVAAAHAAPAGPAVESVAPAPAPADEASHGSAQVKGIVRNAGSAAAAAAALAALLRLIGMDKVRSAAKQVGTAVREAAKTPLRVAGAALKSVAHPFRIALIFAGLAILAFAGIGLYDLEWAAGLAVGGAGVAAVWVAAASARQAFRPRAANSEHQKREVSA